MSQRDKLVAKMRKRPVEADFDDVRKLLEWDGWRKARQSGSHATFVKPGQPTIFTVPTHGGKVKRTYIVQLCELLRLDE